MNTLGINSLSDVVIFLCKTYRAAINYNTLNMEQIGILAGEVLPPMLKALPEASEAAKEAGDLTDEEKDQLIALVHTLFNVSPDAKTEAQQEFAEKVLEIALLSCQVITLSKAAFEVPKP